MTQIQLILRTALFYWRTNVGVIIGVAIAAAVLTGALITGDSIRHTLLLQAEARIGSTDVAMVTGDRFFVDDLGERIAAEQNGLTHAAALYVRCVVATPDGSRTARDVNLLGVDDSFFQLSPDRPKLPLTDDAWLANDRLAAELELRENDAIVVRMEKPSALPRDSVLSDTQDLIISARGTISSIIGDQQFGHFGLSVSQLPPLNLFVSRDWLQAQLNLERRANVLLVDLPPGRTDLDSLNASLISVFTLADMQTRVVDVPDSAQSELRSDRIFIEPAVAEIIDQHSASSTGVLTYFVNTISSDGRETPYSMITAIGPLRTAETDRFDSPVQPSGMADDEIIVNDWLAAELACDAGDSIQVRYFVLDESDRLVEEERTFVVHSIVPMTGLAADRTLMPEFPGIATAESSRDWQPGIPIDLSRVKEQDEKYWQDHRGTPKAFITLRAGQEMWRNRYGDLTSIRFAQRDNLDVSQHLRKELNPASLGFQFRDVRSPAMAAADPTTDFGMLLLGLSSFLIGASLVLTALLFILTVQQRASQVGLQRAVGFPIATARWMMFAEAGLLALIGSTVGAILSVGYTLAILRALESIWSNAIAGASISLHIAPATILLGAGASLVIASLTMHVAIGRLMRRDALSLLRDDASAPALPPRSARLALMLTIIALIGAVVIVVTGDSSGASGASRFFAAGALTLFAGIALCRVVLVYLGHADASNLSVIRLGIRNNSRRIGRGLAVTWMLASGVFLIGSISVHQLDAWENAESRQSGTGGFAFIADTSIPIPGDMNSQRGRDVFSLTEEDLAGLAFVSIRVREGDEASCLNLNRPQSPRLLGVDPSELAERRAFRFARWNDELTSEPSWTMLDVDLGADQVPVIVDDTSALWSMHKTIGDSIEYTDASGKTFDAVIVATIASSILQGNVLLAESEFRRRFPGESGFGMFLIDAADEEAAQNAVRLERMLSDVGFSLQPTVERLAEFNAVQNTYLSVFQVLGGLGLLLGVAGLGVFVARNVIERRRELALLRALGFTMSISRRLIISEHLFLLMIGVAVGVAASVIALTPVLRDSTTPAPVGLIVGILLGLVANGVFWVTLAARWALRGDLLTSLQRE